MCVLNGSDGTVHYLIHNARFWARVKVRIKFRVKACIRINVMA